jgi:hypothetical protein
MYQEWLNPVGNLNAAVMPAKSTTPSYCDTIARVEGPSFVSTSVLINKVKCVEEAPFCVYSARLSGGDFDCISHFIFKSVE